MAQHRAPFVSLWSRDDVRTAVCDFLPIVEDPSPHTSYRIDARLHHDVTGYSRVDISVNGRLVIEGRPFACRPFEKLQLYNFSRGTSHIGPIEIWYEKAAPNQVWHDE